MTQQQKTGLKQRLLELWENIAIVIKGSTLLLWFILFILALLEIKRYYDIDVIPGYDSSVDDVYGAVRGTLSEFLD